MKENSLTKAVEKVVKLYDKAIDGYLQSLVEPLEKVGNPERLINKKFEDWTSQDLEVLASIYGANEPNILSNFIFNKKLKQVEQLEAEVA